MAKETQQTPPATRKLNVNDGDTVRVIGKGKPEQKIPVRPQNDLNKGAKPASDIPKAEGGKI